MEHRFERPDVDRRSRPAARRRPVRGARRRHRPLPGARRLARSPCRCSTSPASPSCAASAATPPAGRSARRRRGAMSSAPSCRRSSTRCRQRRARSAASRSRTPARWPATVQCVARGRRHAGAAGDRRERRAAERRAASAPCRVEQFVLGNRRTARAADELVVAVRVPARSARARSAFAKLGGRRYLTIAVTTVALVVDSRRRTARSSTPALPSAAARRRRAACRRSSSASSARRRTATSPRCSSRRPRAARADRRPARERRLSARCDRDAAAPRPAEHRRDAMTARDLPAIQVVRVDVNGSARELAGDPTRRLADALRDELGLTGTKIGCHAGDCGACTVLLDGEQVCSCIVGVGQCEGRAVTTVEGLAAADGTLVDAAARLRRSRRRPVRHLHARHADGRGGAAAQQRGAERSRRAGRARRRALPLHRLPQDRRGGARRRRRHVVDAPVAAAGPRGRRRASRGSMRAAKVTGAERFGADAAAGAPPSRC